MLLVLLFERYITISKDTYASFFSEWDSCFTLQLLQMNAVFFACLFVCFFLGKFYAFWLYCFSWHQDLFSSFLYQVTRNDWHSGCGVDASRRRSKHFASSCI